MAINFNIQSVSAGGPVQSGRVDASSGFNAIAGGFLNLARGIAQFRQVGKEAENEAGAVNLLNKTKRLLHDGYRKIDQETTDPRIRFTKRSELLDKTVTRSSEQAQKSGFPSSFAKFSSKWFNKEQGDLIDEFDSREASFSLQAYTNTMNNEYLPAFDQAHAGAVFTEDPQTGIKRFELTETDIKNLSSISDRMNGQLRRALDSNDPDKVNTVVTGLRKTGITAQAKQFAVMAARDPTLNLTELVFNTEVLIPHVDVINGESVITYVKPTDAEVQDRAQQAFTFSAQNESRIQFQENRAKAKKEEFVESFRAGMAQMRSVMFETGDFSMLDTMREDLQNVQNQMTDEGRRVAWNELRGIEEVMRAPGAKVSDPDSLTFFTSQLDSKTRFPHKLLETALLENKLTTAHFLSFSSRHASMLSQAETDFDRSKNETIKIVDGLFSTPEAQIIIGDQGGKFTSALRIAVNERISELGVTAVNPDIARNIVFEESEKIMGAAVAGSSVGIAKQEWEKMAQLIIDAPIGEDTEISVTRARQALATSGMSRNKRGILKLGLSILDVKQRLQASGASGFTLAQRPATALSKDPKTTAKKDDQALKETRTVIRRRRAPLQQYDDDVRRLEDQLNQAVSTVRETQESTP